MEGEKERKFKKRLEKMKTEWGKMSIGPSHQLCLDTLYKESADVFSTAPQPSIPPIAAYDPFPYPKQLIWNEVSKLNNSTSHCVTCSDGTNLFTLLIDEQETRRCIYKGFIETEQVLQVNPIDTEEYISETGQPMVACLYPYFETIKDRFTSEEVLQSILKAFILVLHHLEDQNIWPCHISQNSLLCTEGQVGSFLYTPPQPCDNLSFADTFKDLNVVLNGLFVSIPSASPSPSLKSFLSCMNKASSFQLRHRLIQSPYFRTTQQKIYSYIDLMWSATTDFKTYEALVAAYKWKDGSNGWIHKVIKQIADPSGQYSELQEILEANYFDKTGMGFLRFLRITVNHLNDQMAKQQKAAGKGNAKSKTSNPSILMTNPELVLILINKVDDSFLDEFFF